MDSIMLEITVERTGYSFPKEFRLYRDLPDGFLVRHVKAQISDDDMDFIHRTMSCPLEGQNFAIWYGMFRSECEKARNQITDYMFEQSTIKQHP